MPIAQRQQVNRIDFPVEADQQHQWMTHAVARLEDSLGPSGNGESLRHALLELTTLARGDFDNQEASWSANGLLDRGWHGDAHRFLLDYLERLTEDQHRLDPGSIHLRVCFIKQWLKAHFRAEYLDIAPATFASIAPVPSGLRRAHDVML